ncbi:MAG: hypothetical protein A2931_00300 [Candidatus Niyogibacteria bacterium RIFCSPLOWO2_01_FULL_45_48]|uniref:Uncharacterized protein n=2 Tax=Candidatus Niyogiibacteriota TaxID=1817912 RepID=A0A1G2F044_9BACT|nr:MAG: hypothetical protein A2931_00300 [Candidatus Niyogibacteria bacterium RIFCSPLOWO2_01_FULL_45_48]OGZ30628.1 MAG: hypothetical protein A2835_03595 [Candidatus Niyogibacteria bacterium RIFCSPHIGHO2_01_FULL_45_28]OGZ31112.1 MAG: hypothetical protein A3J00_03275 [Candidatus Niyogibacteria bacterium RIFCSPLOWO2_02_FULL_45_13]
MDKTVQDHLSKNIITELGLENVPPKRMEEILLAFGEIIQGRINVRVLDELNDADKDEFDKLLGSKSKPEELDAFLKSKIPDLENLIGQVMADTKQELVEKAKILGA